MNAKLLASPLRRGLALGFALFALFAARSQAVTLSATLANPAFSFPTFSYTETNPALGTFNFSSSPNWGNIVSLGNVNITLTFFNLDTHVGGNDINQIYLTLGGSTPATRYNTGILLNGFTNDFTTLSFNQAPTNEVDIVAALNANHGVLTMGLFDTTNSPSNIFSIQNAAITLNFEGAVVTPVPFTPVQTLGYGLIGLAVLWRRFRGVNPFAFAMARFAR